MDSCAQKRKRKLRDFEIRDALLLRLEATFPEKTGSLVIDEFGCTESRADVAVVNCKLHGYEIKSDRDTLTRLSTQAPTYSSIFDRMTIVATQRHIERISGSVPHWWGIMEVFTLRDCICFRSIRDGSDNADQDAYSLSRMLWRKEAYSILRKRGLGKGLAKASAARLRRVISESIPVSEIAAELRAAIKDRGGSGFDRQRTRNGGSYTKKPTVQRYQSNLDWLLSLQSEHPLR